MLNLLGLFIVILSVIVGSQGGAFCGLAVMAVR